MHSLCTHSAINSRLAAHCVWKRHTYFTPTFKIFCVLQMLLPMTHSAGKRDKAVHLSADVTLFWRLKEGSGRFCIFHNHHRRAEATRRVMEKWEEALQFGVRAAKLPSSSGVAPRKAARTWDPLCGSAHVRMIAETRAKLKNSTKEPQLTRVCIIATQ